MMNRRDFGATVGGLLASWFITPAKRRVDLSAFCHYERTRYDMTRPFVQDEWTYATNNKACLRVRPMSGDVRDDGASKLPPAAALPWEHDRLTLWKPLRLFRPMPLKDCDECEGRGYVVGFDGHSRQKCEECNGRRRILTAHAVGDLVLRVSQFERLTTLGEVEWSQVNSWGIGRQRMLALRFDGGDGLQITVSPEHV